MRQLLIFIFITIAASACKKDDPDNQLNMIAGSWEPVAREELVDGKYVWKDVPPASHYILTFRPDGLITDVNGLPHCCGPNSLSIDGNLIKIIPKGKVPYNAMCELVNCIACETLVIETHSDEMIIVSACGGSKTKYVRKDGI